MRGINKIAREFRFIASLPLEFDRLGFHVHQSGFLQNDGSWQRGTLDRPHMDSESHAGLRRWLKYVEIIKFT